MTFSFHRKNVPAVSWGWREGKYWDFWMVVHFWSGVTIAFVIPFIDASHSFLIGLAFLGLLAWEAIEYFFDIHEVIENRLLDVLYGLAGLLIADQYVIPFLDAKKLPWWLLGAVIVLVLLGLSGWRAYRRRIGDQIAGDLQ